MSDLRETLPIEPAHLRLPFAGGEAGPGADNQVAAGRRSVVTTSRDACLEHASPFHFCISPNISLGHRATLVMIVTLGVPTALLSVLFAVKGYWPITVFSSLTYLGFAAAMVCSRISLKRHEQVFLSNDLLVIERSTGLGKRTRIQLPTFGLRLQSTIDPDYGHLGLALRHRARRLELARDLSPAERSSFEAAYLAAMEAAGRPVRLTTVHTLALAPREQSN